MNELCQYAVLKKHTMIVVFDGGAHDWPLKERHNGLTVVYSGRKESADDYIRTYVDKQAMDNVLLISSDAGLCSWALRCGVESIPAVAFYALVLQELEQIKKVEQSHQKIQSIIKTSQEAASDLDTIMNEVCGTGVKSEHIPAESRKGKSQKLSKKERLMMKKIIKL